MEKKEDDMDEMDFWLQNDFLGNHIKEKQRTDILQKYAEILQYVADSEFYNENALKKWANPKVADPWIIATTVVITVLL
ncbi:DUF4411 family protein [Tetragenococcus halophilus]|nr:DUF4411 family protein [Tetragenococcus halophilus]